MKLVRWMLHADQPFGDENRELIERIALLTRFGKRSTHYDLVVLSLPNRAPKHHIPHLVIHVKVVELFEIFFLHGDCLSELLSP